jgi:hypothetical protein
MFSSRVGRLQFFLYSIAIWIAELIGIVLCIAVTMGFDGLFHSKPGPSRETLVFASFAVMMMFAIARMNLAWRRGYDADLSKWKLLVPYVMAVALFPVLQAGMLFVYDFNTGTTNGGFNIFSIAFVALWWRICRASPKSRPPDPDAFLAAEGRGGSPGGPPELPATASVSAGASIVSAPANLSTRGYSNASGVTFGKRGLA